MSTALGVAAVTAVLKTILNNGLIEAGLSSIVGGSVTVSSLPPDRISLTGAADPNQLNIFLHQTTLNPALRNLDLPTRGPAGELINNPPLPVNLHYLMSAYGSQDYYPELILGYAMQVLHENSVLTRNTIRRALLPPAPVPGLPKELADSRLADQVEQIKVTPEVLSTEELSRLWSAMNAHYRPSISYQVTVVLIEGARSTSAALPVAGPSSTSVPFPQLLIEQVLPDSGPGTPFLPTSKLVITGQNLRAEDVRLRIGDQEFVPAKTDVTPRQIVFPLPAILPAGFYAGVKGVQVIQAMPLGAPPAAHTIFHSNVEPIVLRPVIVATPEVGASTVIDGVTYRSGQMKIDFVPNVGKAQEVILLLNEFSPPATRLARAYSFSAPAGNGITTPGVKDTATVRIPFKLVEPGDYLVRVRVDGAESVLTMAAGIYSNPRVTI
jgi:hypothetical protein